MSERVIYTLALRRGSGKRRQWYVLCDKTQIPGNLNYGYQAGQNLTRYWTRDYQSVTGWLGPRTAIKAARIMRSYDNGGDQRGNPEIRVVEIPIVDPGEPKPKVLLWTLEQEAREMDESCHGI